MDTTPKNIEMCNKATEIQDMWEPSLGDWFISIREPNGGIVGEGMLSILNYVPGGKKRLNKEALWLPRQDQLQKMLDFENQSHLVDLFNAFIDVLWWEENHWVTPETSLEQLWLAFVMQQKYNKVWDDEKERWNNEDFYYERR